MNILGISDTHNASACLIIDGQLVAAVQEERFTRVKNWAGFPVRSVRWLLDWAGLAPTQIDHVAFHSITISPRRVLQDIERSLRWVDRPFIPTLWRVFGVADIYPHRFQRQIQRQRLRPLRSLGLPTKSVSFVEHHTAHAVTSYYGQHREPGEAVLILTCDGSGDRLCATANIAQDGHLERIAAVSHTMSVGLLYSLVTLLLGMKPGEDEYKVMGLAPYAPSHEAEALAQKFRSLFVLDEPTGLTWECATGAPDWRVGLRFLRRFLDGQRFDVIAGGVQRFLEEWLCTWVRRSIEATGIKNLALAGGVFKNVKVNQIIAAMPEVESVFIFPSAGDESGAIGAAWHVYQRLTHSAPDPLSNLYLGPEYSNSQIRSAIEGVEHKGWHWDFIEDIDHITAQLLTDGHVVARFQGRMEFGARALGHRSILADAARQDIVRVLNASIKHRDFWMPFAPTILDDYADTYLVSPKQLSAPYMTITFDTTPRRKELQATLHPYDFTTRPQILTESHSPSYYRLIREFEALTGRGAILNTSFNLHGEPIVCRPEHALYTFRRSGLNYLAMGNYLIRKQDC